MSIEPPRSKVHSVVRQAGGGEIREDHQDDITVVSVSGPCTRELLDALERLMGDRDEDVGLDLRALEDPTPALLPTLKGLHRALEGRKRLLLLFRPPSKLLDLIELDGSTDDFLIYDESRRVTRKPESRPSAKDLGPAAERVVHFETDLERAHELESSVDKARQLALRMLCRPVPPMAPFSISTAYIPHDKIGGDFFLVRELGSQVGVGIGDVSGHGLDAALIMGVARKVLEIRAGEGAQLDPAQVLKTVNHDLHPELDRYTFITGFYAMLDRNTGRVRFARAGHVYPLHVVPAAGTAEDLRSSGIAFGLDPGATFDLALELGEVHLAPGDVILLYTDGVIEAEHPRKGPFGVERLRAAAREIPVGSGAEAVRDHIIERLQAYLEGTALQDDLTLIPIVYSGEAAPDEA